MIPYNRELNVKNVESLPRGGGCRYLVVIASHVNGEWIAKRWARKRPIGEEYIDFGPRKPAPKVNLYAEGMRILSEAIRTNG